MKDIEIRNGRIVYYGNDAGYVDNGKAVVDTIFCGDALSYFLKKEKLEALWTNGVYDRLSAASETMSETDQLSVSGQAHGFHTDPVLKSCRVWQLKPDVDIHMKFIGYDELFKNFGEPDPANYRLAYDGQVETNDLEALYAKFNMANDTSLIQNAPGIPASVCRVNTLGFSVCFVRFPFAE